MAAKKKTKKYTVVQAAAEIVEKIRHSVDMSETDNHGQIVIYTGLFKWNDGTIRETPQGVDLDDC